MIKLINLLFKKKKPIKSTPVWQSLRGDSVDIENISNNYLKLIKG